MDFYKRLAPFNFLLILFSILPGEGVEDSCSDDRLEERRRIGEGLSCRGEDCPTYRDESSLPGPLR